MFSRAIRRHHVERIKKKRNKYWSWDDKDPRRLGMLVHTPAMCSCWMCGNERKYFKNRTVDEISFDEVNSIVDI